MKDQATTGMVATTPETAPTPGEIRTLVSRADGLLDRLQAVDVRMRRMRGRLLCPPEEADEPPVSEVPKSEIGELHDLLSRLDGQTERIIQVLEDLERI